MKALCSSNKIKRTTDPIIPLEITDSVKRCLAIRLGGRSTHIALMMKIRDRPSFFPVEACSFHRAGKGKMIMGISVTIIGRLPSL